MQVLPKIDQYSFSEAKYQNKIGMVGVMLSTTSRWMTKSSQLLLLLLSLPTVTSSFHTITNVGIGQSRPVHYPSVGHRQQQLQRDFLLYSSTALTSPLQPLPEEPSTIGENQNGDTSIKITDSTNIGVSGDTKLQLTKRQQKLEFIKSKGGRFSFNTKYGALNPFAIYYGLTSILLGLPWFVALTCYQLIQYVTRGRFDRLRRIPVHLNQLWGESLLVLTRCFPEMIHRDRLQKFYKEYVVIERSGIPVCSSL